MKRQTISEGTNLETLGPDLPWLIRLVGQFLNSVFLIIIECKFLSTLESDEF